MQVRKVGTQVVVDPTTGEKKGERSIEMQAPDRGYRFADDGSGTILRTSPKLRGKAAVKAAKRERQDTARRGVKLLVLR